VWLDKPVHRVLAILPEMYDDLWTGAKGMYKLEPVIADGGEVVLYAPHITEVSKVHGKLIEEIGYHCRDYFTKQWAKFGYYPGGILAHSTHVRGKGTFEDGVEAPRIRVTLATGISEELCGRINLGYMDPAMVKDQAWDLEVPHAGEMLYRVKP
jgi:nickel-dependent lactate racemase